jgi:hypothetical protein
VTDVTPHRYARSPCRTQGDPYRRRDDATEEGTKMLSGDMARFQIADRVREAESDRRARGSRRSRSLDQRGTARRVGRAAISAVLWPIKH